jgi:hypothetical protein
MMSADADHRDPFASPEIPPRWPLAAVGASLALLALASAGLWLVFTASVQTQQQPPATQAPAPRLQTDPSVELQRVLAAQRRRLAGYRWVDRDAGLISIPIDRAMALIAKHGADTYAPISDRTTPQGLRTQP